MDHTNMQINNGTPVMGQSNTKEYAKFSLLIVIIIVVAYGLSTLYPQTDLFIKDLMLKSMGVSLVVFAIFQLIGYKMFVSMFADYDPIAKRIKAYSYAYPFIGLGLGLLYIFNILALWRDIFTAIIMLVGAYGVWRTIREKKNTIHCACLGNIIKLPLSTVALIEDVVMGLMALIMVAMSLGII